MEGPLSAEYEMGKIGIIPEAIELRDIGEKMQTELVSFNYLTDFEGKINILNQEEREYSVSKASSVGAPSVQENNTANVFEKYITYGDGSIGRFDLISRKFTKFSISSVYNPPQAQLEDIESNRPITMDIADRAARKWLDKIGLDLTGYKLKETEAKNDAYVIVTYIQELPDSLVQSPNYARVIVDFWGMVVSFENNIGETPRIGTKPNIDEEKAYENVLAYASFPNNYQPKFKLARAIKRTYELRNNLLFAKDRLIYFADLSKELNPSRAFVEVDAENGEVLR